MDFEIMYQKVRQMLDSKEVSLRETAVFWRDRHKEDPADPIYKALYDQKLAEWSVVQDLISQIEFLENRIRAGRDDEIQDLKLENDRLKRRNELMKDYIHAVACIKSKKSKFYGLCDNVQCPYYVYDNGFGQGACQLGSRELMEQEAADIIEKLEEL